MALNKINENMIEESFTNKVKNVETKTTELTQQLADTVESINSSGKKSEAMATIIFDDGYIWDYTKVFPLFEGMGIAGSSALISSFVNSNDERFLNTSQINEMRSKGWEFMSHTKTHSVLTGLNKEQQVAELVESKSILESMGLEIEGVVYPENKYNSETIDIVKEHYKFGFAIDLKDKKRYVNYAPVNQFAIYRVTLENPPYMVKPLIDKAIAKGGWIVLMAHSNRYDDKRSDINTQQMWDYMVENVQYLIDSGINIVTAKEAYEVFGNSINIGEDATSSNRFAVSKDGTAGGNGLLSARVIDDGSIKNSTDAYTFADNTYTIAPILQVDGADFPTSGGTLHVYNFGERLDFVTQLWMPYNNNRLYTRRWLWNDKKWTDWDLTSDGNLSIPLGNANITAATPPSGFVANKIEVHSFLTADGGLSKGFPSNAGILTTNRAGSVALTTQKWDAYARGGVYKRYWDNSSSSWTPWKREGWTVTDYTMPIPVLNGGSVTPVTFNIEGLVRNSVINLQVREDNYNSDVLFTTKCLTDGVLTMYLRNLSANAKPLTSIKTTLAFINQ